MGHRPVCRAACLFHYTTAWPCVQAVLFHSECSAPQADALHLFA